MTMVHLPASKDQFYKTKLCPHHETGGCRKKVDCFFAHGKEELRIAPDLRKTKLCQDFLKNGSCSRGRGCMYAHAEKELRFTDGYWKTDLCKYWKSGGCTSGHVCRHAHGQEELRPARKHKQEKVDTKHAGRAATPGSRQSKQEGSMTRGIAMESPMGGECRESFSMRHCQMNGVGSKERSWIGGDYMTPQAGLMSRGFLMTPLNQGGCAKQRGFGFVAADRVEEEEGACAQGVEEGSNATGQEDKADVKEEQVHMSRQTTQLVRTHPKILFVGREDMEGDDDCFGKAVPMDGGLATPRPDVPQASARCLLPPPPPPFSADMDCSLSSLEDVTVDLMDEAYIDGISSEMASEIMSCTPDSGLCIGGRTVIRNITVDEVQSGGCRGADDCPDIRVARVNGVSSTEVHELVTCASECTTNQATDVVYCTASTPSPLPPSNVHCLSHLPLSKRPSLSVPSPSITSFSRKGRSSLRLNFIPPPPKDIPPPPAGPCCFGIPPPPPTPPKSMTSPAPSRSSGKKTGSRGGSYLPPPPPRMGSSVASTVCSTVPSRSNSIASSRGVSRPLFIPPPPPADGAVYTGKSSALAVPPAPCSPCGSSQQSMLPLSPLSPQPWAATYADMAAVTGAAWEEEGRRIADGPEVNVPKAVCTGSDSGDWHNGAAMVSSSCDGGRVYYTYLPVAVDENGTVMYAPMFTWEKVDSGVPVDLQAKFHMVPLQELAMSCQSPCYAD
eukprot:GHVS01098608.1.p1 GENE.GHVS01098608.1~~GHVS01098608.1.p1  ORF type:complete len:727 (+),score=148.77 GHVS01098608.1:331-2511(+)